MLMLHLPQSGEVRGLDAVGLNGGGVIIMNYVLIITEAQLCSVYTFRDANIIALLKC